MKKAKHDAARKAIHQEPPPTYRPTVSTHATNPRARRKQRDGERRNELGLAFRRSR